MAALLWLPGLCHVLKPPGAVDLLHVSHADLRSAHGHEMRPRPTDGEFSQIGQGLADGRSEQESAHHLVERRHVLVEVAVGVELLAVDQISFPGGDLREYGRVRDTSAARGGRKERRIQLTMMTVQEMVTAANMPWVMVSALRGYLMLSSSQ